MHYELGGCCLAVGAAAPHCCTKFFKSLLWRIQTILSITIIWIRCPYNLSSGPLFYHFSLLPFIRSSNSSVTSVLPVLHFYVHYSSVIQCHRSPFLLSSVPPWSCYSKTSTRSTVTVNWWNFFLYFRRYNCSGKEAVLNMKGATKLQSIHSKKLVVINFVTFSLSAVLANMVKSYFILIFIHRFWDYV
jgi:hypothetical protein